MDVKVEKDDLEKRLVEKDEIQARQADMISKLQGIIVKTGVGMDQNTTLAVAQKVIFFFNIL